MLFLVSAYLFQNKLFPKILTGSLPECQTAWVQIMADILSVLIWVLTVCKGYQQTTKIITSMERFKSKEGKDQESIQSSATPDPGHHMGK